MERLQIENVIKENIEDLCKICISPEMRDDPGRVKGAEEKRKWAVEMQQKSGSFAKLAYHEGIPVGMIQYRPIPEEKVVYIYCISVPWDKPYGRLPTIES
jgi:hypothetical protein